MPLGTTELFLSIYFFLFPTKRAGVFWGNENLCVRRKCEDGIAFISDKLNSKKSDKYQFFLLQSEKSRVTI